MKTSTHSWLKWSWIGLKIPTENQTLTLEELIGTNVYHIFRRFIPSEVVHVTRFECSTITNLCRWVCPSVSREWCISTTRVPLQGFASAQSVNSESIMSLFRSQPLIMLNAPHMKHWCPVFLPADARHAQLISFAEWICQRAPGWFVQTEPSSQPP